MDDFTEKINIIFNVWQWAINNKTFPYTHTITKEEKNLTLDFFIIILSCCFLFINWSFLHWDVALFITFPHGGVILFFGVCDSYFHSYSYSKNNNNNQPLVSDLRRFSLSLFRYFPFSFSLAIAFVSSKMRKNLFRNYRMDVVCSQYNKVFFYRRSYFLRYFGSASQSYF